MTTYIVQPGRKEWVEFSHDFDYVDHPGSGCSFDCDEAGNLLDPTPMRVSYFAEAKTLVRDGKALIDLGIRRRERSYWESGSIRCDCGQEHHLERGDSSCDNCGQDYNTCGQRLNHPHMWDDIDHQP